MGSFEDGVAQEKTKPKGSLSIRIGDSTYSLPGRPSEIAPFVRMTWRKLLWKKTRYGEWGK